MWTYLSGWDGVRLPVLFLWKPEVSEGISWRKQRQKPLQLFLFETSEKASASKRPSREETLRRNLGPTEPQLFLPARPGRAEKHPEKRFDQNLFFKWLNSIKKSKSDRFHGEKKHNFFKEIPEKGKKCWVSSQFVFIQHFVFQRTKTIYNRINSGRDWPSFLLKPRQKIGAAPSHQPDPRKSCCFRPGCDRPAGSSPEPVTRRRTFPGSFVPTTPGLHAQPSAPSAAERRAAGQAAEVTVRSCGASQSKSQLPVTARDQELPGSSFLSPDTLDQMNTWTTIKEEKRDYSFHWHPSHLFPMSFKQKSEENKQKRGARRESIWAP